MPVYRKRKDNEYYDQCAIVAWFRIKYPDCLLTTCPGGMRTSMRQAVKNKKSGYLKGTPDILILEQRGGFGGLFIELKIKGGTLYDHQVEFLENLRNRKYWATVCYGYDEAVETIDGYMRMPNYAKN